MWWMNNNHNAEYREKELLQLRLALALHELRLGSCDVDYAVHFPLIP